MKYCPCGIYRQLNSKESPKTLYTWIIKKNTSLKVYYVPIVFCTYINTYNLTHYHVNKGIKPQVLKLIYGSPQK